MGIHSFSHLLVPHTWTEHPPRASAIPGPGDVAVDNTDKPLRDGAELRVRGTGTEVKKINQENT